MAERDAACRAKHHRAPRLGDRRPTDAAPRATASANEIRKRVEEIFGWTKTVANFRRTRFKDRERTQLASYFVGAAYSLLRMGRLLEAASRSRVAQCAAGA